VTQKEESSSPSAAFECRSTCARDDHLEIALSLGTTAVEGWVGSYFTVHPYNPSTHESTSFDYAGRNTPIFGGTLEWGSLEEKTLCLPSRAECYEVSDTVTDHKDLSLLTLWLPS
jgi:hypothetical protein